MQAQQREEDEGLTAALLLLLACQSRSGGAMDFPFFHKSPPDPGSRGSCKEGAEPPYLGRVQAPGAVCAMPRAPPQKKNHLGNREPALAPLPALARAPDREKLCFL